MSFGILLFSGSIFAGESSVQFVSAPTIRANPNPAVPLAAILTFETKMPVSTRIEIICGDGARVLEYGYKTSPEKGLPIIGFIPGAQHEIRVTISNASGESAISVLKFTAPSPFGLK